MTESCRLDSCPYCNKPLNEMTDAYYEKHIARCSRLLPIKRYSDRPRGRPSKKDYAEAGIKRR